jgi:hypothetical protein
MPCGDRAIKKSDLGLPDEDFWSEVDKIIETKIDPSLFSKKIPDREAMFSEKYKGGVNPKIKSVVKKFEQEINQRYEWRKSADNKYEPREKKTTS